MPQFVPGIVAFDAEDTLFGTEGLICLAEQKFGHGSDIAKRVTEITNDGMAGASFRDSVMARLRLLGPIDTRLWDALGAEYIRTTKPGAREAILGCQKLGFKPIVVSGGFLEGLKEATRALGFSDSTVRALSYDSERNAPHEHPLLADNGKLIVVQRAIQALPPPINEKVYVNGMIGDGMTDARVKGPNTAFFAVGSRPNVLNEADAVLHTLHELPQQLRAILKGNLPLLRGRDETRPRSTASHLS